MMAKGIAKSLRAAGRNKYIKHQEGQSIDKELLKNGNVKPSELPDSQNWDTLNDIIGDKIGKEIEQNVKPFSKYNKEAQEAADRFDRLDHIGHAGVLVGELARLGAPRSLIEKIAPTDPKNIYDYELASAIAQSFHTDLFSTAEDFDRYLELSGYSQRSRKGAVASYETFNITGDKTLATAGAAHAIDPKQPSVTEFVSLQGEYLGVTPYDYPQNTPLFDLEALNAFLAQNRMAGEHVNAVEHTLNMAGYGRLQAELQRAGAPASLLESLAKGSGASAFNKNGVNPSMAAAMMRGIEGRSVIDDVRYSALDKLAGEHARLEHERTGDVTAATQAGVDAVRAAKEANAGQAPLSGLSNKQVAEKAVQGYRDNLMKGSRTVESGTYAGSSQEHSPEDLMTAQQNRRQLETQQAKRPRGPRTVTLDLPLQDYLSSQTLEAARRADTRKVDTSGFNMDLLNKPAKKTLPGQFEVTLGGWPTMSAAKPQPTTTQQNVPTPKNASQFTAKAADEFSDRQRAKEAAQIRAQKDGLLAEEAKASRASAKEDTLDDVDFAAGDEQNAKAAKADTLGGDAFSKAQAEQKRQEQDAVDKEQAARTRANSDKKTKDNSTYVGVGTAAGRDAASQISMGSGTGRSTGYNDRQDLATALSKSGQHGNVGVSNLTGYGTIRGSQQTKMLGDDPEFAPDAFENGSSGGGNSRVICTELVRQGLMAPSLQRLDIAYTLRHLPPATVRGYHAWAVPYVRLMKRSNVATRLVEPLARWRAEEIAYLMKARSRAHYRGRVVRWIGEPMCWVLGTVLGWCGDPDRFYPLSGRNEA